jgi:hypothetical protein
VGLTPAAGVEFVQLSTTSGLPGGLLAVTAVGALTVPVLAFPVPKPWVVQYANVAAAPWTIRTRPRTMTSKNLRVDIS